MDGNMQKNQLLILSFIQERKRTSLFDIVRDLSLDKNEVKEVLEYLKEKGLIKWLFKSADGNIRSIKLTADGLDKIESAKPQDITPASTKQETVGLTTKTNLILEKLNTLEAKIDSIESRKNRERNYKITIISLLIATFIGVAFNSFVEFLTRNINQKFYFFVTIFYYFVALLSIIIIFFLFNQLQSISKIKEYSFSAKFDLGDYSREELTKDIRKLISTIIKPRKVKYKFNGIIWYKFEHWLKSRKESFEIKESTAFEFKDKVKEVTYVFFDNKKNNLDATTMHIYFKQNVLEITHEKKLSYDKVLLLKEEIKKFGIVKYNFHDIFEDGY